jgi:DNA repair protein RecO (recombination protein O)
VTQYRDTGVVLRTWKLGEADRIVVLFTRDHGKVRAVAKGVRRTRSKFGARLEPTSHVSLQMHVGRTLDTIVQAETIEHHRALREDLDRLAQAVTMLEVVDQLALEGEADRPLFQMLVRAMATLAERDTPLVLPGFLLKALGASGFGPVVDACAVCGVEGPLVAFDTERGGLLCASHRQGMAVSPEAAALLARILGGGLAGALDEPASPATHEVTRVATTAMEHHLERRLRAPTVLHRR